MRKFVSILFALVLVASFGLVTAVPVSASPLSITPVTPTDIEVGPAYTELTGPAIMEDSPGEIIAGTIILTAPVGFTFDTGSDVTATVTAGDLQLGPAPGSAMQTVTPTEGSITIDVFSVSTTASTISYSGIKIQNTNTAGTTGDLDFSGTAGVTGIAGTLTSVPGPAASIVISPDTATITAGDFQAYTAMAYDEFGNEVGDVTAETTFFIAVEAGGGWDFNTYTSEVAGTWDVLGDYGGLTDTASLTVNPGPPASIVISPDTATITAGESQTYTAEATDAYGNSFDVTADTTFSIDTGAGGGWVANVYTSELVGTWTVTGTYEGLTDDATLTVNPGPAASIVIFPDTATITAGQTQTYTAMAYDGFGNEVGDVTADTTFSIDTGAGGGWVANVYTSELVGTWTVTGTYEGLTDDATLTVNPGPAASIVIFPDTATITAGDSQAYTAMAYDAYGNEVGDVTAGTAFSIEAGAGGSWAANAYTSEVADTWQVTGDYDGLTDTASLTVNPGAAVSFVFAPIPPQTAGVPFPITITALDDYGNTATGYTGTATLSDLTGTIQPDATTAFMAGVWMGDVTITGWGVDITITATDGTITGTSANFYVYHGDPVSIVISPDTATITAGDGQAYTAVATDAYGNIFDVTTGTYFYIEAGAGGSWADSVYTSELAGTWTVTGEYETDVTDTATLTVEPGAAVSIVILPDTTTITAGDSQEYTATAYDEFGNAVGDVTAGTTFSIQAGAGGSWAANVYTSEVAYIFPWTVTGTYGELTDTASLTVNPDEAASIVISPDTATITAGESQAYTAEAFDAYGNFVGDVTDFTSFSIEEGAGGYWDIMDEYWGQFAGTWQVTGAYGELTGYAILTVDPGPAVGIVVSPPTATITAGDNITYTATANDDYGNSFNVTADTTFSIEAGASGSWDANVYTSELAGTWTVTGTYGGLTDTASLTVEPGTVETLMIVQQPTETTAGAVIAPPVTVKAEDGFGNAIANQDVIPSLQVGTGTLSGAPTQVTDASGIATFADLSIDLAGVIKVLRFTANSVTVDSNPFTIYPAPVFDNLFPLKAGWTLISTDSEVDTESSAFIGATLVLKYTASGFLSANFSDLKPVEALYVKMPDGGWVGLNYLDVVPGVSAKDLVAGWNLVSSATADNAAAVLSPLRYVQVGEEQGVGLTTLVSQGSYNLSGINFYVATLIDADWEILAMTGLSPFDGYWVYMNAAKSFGVIPSPGPLK